MAAKHTNLIGANYHRLTITAIAEPSIRKNGKKDTMVVAICDCGVEKIYQMGNLRSGTTKSCGCLSKQRNKEIAEKRSPPQTWQQEGDSYYAFIFGVKITVSAEDIGVVSGIRWNVDRLGYAKTSYSKMMHVLIIGDTPQKGLFIDHVNGNPSDNRRSNLRFATPKQNSANSKPRKGHLYKGVSKMSNGKYSASIGQNGKKVWLGTYKTQEQAAKAYDMAAISFSGEYARLNFPTAPS